MAIPSASDRANFETTKRLLAQIINEGLVSATVEEGVVELTQRVQRHLCIRSLDSNGSYVKVNLKPNTFVDGGDDGKVRSLVLPESLEPPVIIGGEEGAKEYLSPDEVFRAISSWFVSTVGETAVSADRIALELRNSADNQKAWLDLNDPPKLLDLDCPAINWERTLIFGHPTQTFHRLCYAEPPMEPVKPVDLPGMLAPDLAFVSVPRADMRVVGPFEQYLKPLHEKLEVEISTAAIDEGRMIIPCFARQVPAILLHFPNAVFIKSAEKAAYAQASMRTVSAHPDLKFDYHLKLSLGCQLTSGVRTIGSWVASAGPVFSELLDKLLPADLWVYKEVAAATGAQTEFRKGRHLSCILREDLEARARSINQTLIMTGALAQRPLNSDGQSYAEILFALKTDKEKKSWFAGYIACLFKLILSPLVHHGIGMEAHSQNLVARVCLQTGQVKGFAIRDFGGIRLHMPTLESQGFGIDPSRLSPDGTAMTDDLEDVWAKVHHALLQNHIGNLIGAMRLDINGDGWAIVREELAALLLDDDHSGAGGKKIYQFFMKETMPFKCFLRMKMEGRYRDCIERELPNILLPQ